MSSLAKALTVSSIKNMSDEELRERVAMHELRLEAISREVAELKERVEGSEGDASTSTLG